MAKRNLKAIVITLVAVAAIAIVSAITTIFSGAYDVTATKQHTAPVYWTLDTAVRQAIKHGARDISAPSLDSPDMIRRGLSLYRDSCAQCHGAPGVAPAPFSHGMMPLPNSLAQTARQWKAEEVYWVTRNGLKMTGMPAWRFRYPDADLWAIVAFVMNMPSLTARDYATMSGVQQGPVEILWKETTATGDARRGELAVVMSGGDE